MILFLSRPAMVQGVLVTRGADPEKPFGSTGRALPGRPAEQGHGADTVQLGLDHYRERGQTAGGVRGRKRAPPGTFEEQSLTADLLAVERCDIARREASPVERKHAPRAALPITRPASSGLPQLGPGRDNGGGGRDSAFSAIEWGRGGTVVGAARSTPGRSHRRRGPGLLREGTARIPKVVDGRSFSERRRTGFPTGPS